VAPIVVTTDIARPPEEVFSYATDPSRFGEWQVGVVSGGTEGVGPPGVGTRCTVTRKLGGAERTLTSEITELDPPRTWAIHGIDGPLRADVKVTVIPAGDSGGSRITIALDFFGRGIGKAILPIAVRQARKEAPQSCQTLKTRLEGGE
jgi:uncharacterized protein YndB with AHSA1/START domain